MGFLPRWLRENFRVKFGLFILAVLLWFLVISERTYEHSIMIPIEVVGISPEKVLVNEIPDEAEVKFQAQGRELIRLQFTDSPSLQLDVSTISHFYTFRLHPDMVVIPSGLHSEVVSVIRPDSVKIILEERLELKLPVSPKIKVSPAAGYTFVGDFRILPPEVTVAGPRGKVVRLKSIDTEPVEFKTIKSNTELELNLIQPDIYGITIIPSSVKVIIRVERLGERRIEQVPISVINIPRGREVVVDPLSVELELKGGISILTNLSPDSIRAWVDFKEFDVIGGRRTPVHVVSPERTEVVQITPSDVRLIVRRK